MHGWVIIRDIYYHVRDIVDAQGCIGVGWYSHRHTVLLHDVPDCCLWKYGTEL